MNKEYYVRAFKQWLIGSLSLISLFFIYHLVLVPNIKLIELLVNGKTSSYYTHLSIKILLLLFIFFCFINLNVLYLIQNLDIKYFKKNKLPKKKYIIFVKCFSIYLWFFYLTLILLIPARSLKEFLDQSLILKGKTFSNEYEKS